MNPNSLSRAAGPAAALHPLALGASLYLPATRADLGAILEGRKHPRLKSVIVCLEDAVSDRDVPGALYNLQCALETASGGPLCFVRPRDPAMLRRILRLPGAGSLDGIVLPKIDERNLGAFAEAADHRPELPLMPIIETEVAFCRDRLARLRQRILAAAGRVLCLRIGGNDLLRLLGLQRPRQLTLYETPLRGVVEDLLRLFKPAGFELTAPVFGFLDSPALLAREAELDVAHGLLPKAAVCPAQAAVIERAYRVSHRDHESARALLAPGAPAVFGLHGQMLETAVHRPWAERLLLQAAFFGLESRGGE